MQYRLFKFAKDTGITVQPDATFPAMWRIHWADGSVSSMCNLSRAKDDARQSVGNSYWKTDAQRGAAEAPPAAGSQDPSEGSAKATTARHGLASAVRSVFQRGSRS